MPREGIHGRGKNQPPTFCFFLFIFFPLTRVRPEIRGTWRGDGLLGGALPPPIRWVHTKHNLAKPPPPPTPSPPPSPLNRVEWFSTFRNWTHCCRSGIFSRRRTWGKVFIYKKNHRVLKIIIFLGNFQIPSVAIYLFYCEGKTDWYEKYSGVWWKIYEILQVGKIRVMY